MKLQDFRRQLRLGSTVALSAKEWDEIAPHFSVVERHDTQLAGDLLIVRLDNEYAAVEEPSRNARVARLLVDMDEVRVFVEKRLSEYERMWDGCGVKVDYLEKD
jgi:hypothetical protein